MHKMNDEGYKEAKNQLRLQWESTFQPLEDDDLLTNTIDFLEEYKERSEEDEKKEKKVVNSVIKALEIYQKYKYQVGGMDNLAHGFINFFRYNIKFIDNLHFLKIQDCQKDARIEYINQRMAYDFDNAQKYIRRGIRDIEDELEELDHRIKSPKAIKMDKVSVNASTVDYEKKMIDNLQRKEELQKRIEYLKEIEHQIEEAEEKQKEYFKKHSKEFKPKDTGGYERVFIYR